MSDQPTDVIIPFVLDRSGSMSSVVGATIEGFNSLLSEQREQDGNAYLSLTLFDNQFEVPFVAWNVKDIPNMGTPQNPFTPRGGTALYDAVGLSIQGTETWLKNNEWFTGKVLFVILTDGQENSSTKWTIAELNSKIAQKSAEGWEFLFLGAGGSAWTEGNKFTSIPAANRMTRGSSSRDHAQTYAGVSSSLSSYRSTGLVDNSALTSTNVTNGVQQSVDAAVDALSGTQQ